MRIPAVHALYKVHAWVGLITGLFLILITVSGAVVVFKPEIDRAANPSLLTVEPAGERLPPGRLWAAVRLAYPDADIQGFELPREPAEVSSFTVKTPKGFRQVLLDPYSGRVLGERNRSATLADWLRQFHVRLLMGFWGRVFVGFFGVTLLLSTITGLLIYTRFNKGSWVPKVRWGGNVRVVTADLHKAVGIGTLAFNLIFAVTGAVLGLENLYNAFNRPTATPTAREKSPGRPPAPSPDLIEACTHRAGEVLPGTEPSRVQIVGRKHVRVYMEHPPAHLVREAASYVAFHADSGEVAGVYDATRAGFWARLYYTMEPLHFGRFGGLPLKLLYTLAGLAAGFLSVSGYVLYVARRRLRGRRGAGAEPAEAAAAQQPGCAVGS